MDTLGLFNLTALQLLGAALLVSTSIVYGPERRRSTDLLRRMLTTAGWFLVGAGFTGALVLMLSWAVVPLAVIGLVAVVLAFRSFQRQEQAVRMGQIMLAAERRMPLADMLDALAREGSGLTGWKTRRQADLLAEGASLYDALAATRDLPSRGAALAIGAGGAWGRLGPALRESLDAESDLEFSLRADVARLFYLYLLVLQIAGVTLYFLLRLAPMLSKMMEEFDLPPGANLQRLLAFEEFLAGNTGPLIRAAPWTLLILIAGVAYYADLWPRRFPLWALFTKRLDGAAVLRGLAWGVEAGAPVDEALRIVAFHYDSVLVRLRLDSVVRRVERGESWTRALATAKLIGEPDVAVLDSAQRAGNLAWALREQAAGLQRRWGLWTQRLLTLVFPVVLALLGALVALVCLALFEGLVELLRTASEPVR